jgi:hypothetical protein
MLFFPKLNNRNCGKMLTVTSVQDCDDRKSDDSTAIKQRGVQETNPGRAFTVTCRVLSVLVGLAVAPSLILAEDGDHDRDQGRFVDPIVGSWVIHVHVTTFTPTPNPPPPFDFDNLAAFWEDGIITTSDPTFGTGYGVWKRVGNRTYDTKFLVVVPPGLGYPPGTIQTIFADGTVLNPQGDHMSGRFHGFDTDPSGKVIDFFEGTVEDDRITFSKP